MANSELYDKNYTIPEDVLNYIQKNIISNPSGNGVKRAKFIVKNRQLTYQAIKRLKNFFDTFNPNTGDNIQYTLAGGDLMKNYIDSMLNTDRTAVERGKEIKRDITADPNSELHVHKAVSTLNEVKKKLKENAIAVIVDNNNKILLLKRSDFPKQWMPEKWSLVGGGIEEDETPLQACKREVKEETGLELGKVIKSYSIQRNPNSIEHIFAARFKGDSSDIILNEENTNYGWFSVPEMKFLDIVPNLVEYITMVFKKYD